MNKILHQSNSQQTCDKLEQTPRSSLEPTQVTPKLPQGHPSDEGLLEHAPNVAVSL